jgi:S1-C subfamily serine protease
MDVIVLVVAVILSLATPAAGMQPEASLGDNILETANRLSAPVRVDPGKLAALSPRPGEVLNSRRLNSSLARLKPDLLTGTRGVRESQLYVAVSPSVVLVVSKDGIGSGSLVSTDGKILTNWHVVNRDREVGIVFKPELEGGRITRSDVYRAKVIRVDEIADLALLQAQGVSPHAKPLPLGSMEQAAVGADVHAIGHPTGESWTYTKGIISQVRRGYEWSVESGRAHKADVIQTQTPINPGNSGGPLLADDGRLVGVNSFKAPGEGLNFAVAVDEVQRFLASSTDRRHSTISRPAPDPVECRPRELRRGRSTTMKADKVIYDLTCTGKENAILTIPDDPKQPMTLGVDSQGNGKIDIVYVDLDRDGEWDTSYYDTDGDGKPDLIGYHRDGEWKPYRFERAVASR